MSDVVKLLLVDDDEMSGKLLSSRLNKKGFTCHYVSNAKDCFKAIEEEEYHCVLLDIMMPDISGTEALKKIREQKNRFELPIIMVTAKDETNDIVQALKIGANDYLTKPVNMDIAVARISTQTQIKSLVEESLLNKQAATINTMVTTLNHEINNPLAIAVGNLSIDKENVTLTRAEKALNALDRIRDIVKKIEKITSGQISEVSYSDTVNMFDLHDEKKKTSNE